MPVLPCDPVSATTAGRSGVDDVAGEPAEGGHGVVDDDGRHAGRAAAQHGGGAGRDRGGGVVVPVDLLPRDRDEQAAGSTARLSTRPRR